MLSVNDIPRGGARAEENYWFEILPVALSSEDFSVPYAMHEELRRNGVTDLRTYLANHPDELDLAIQSVTVRAANQALVELRGFERAEQILGSIPPERIDDHLRGSFTDQFVALWERRTQLALPSTEQAMGNRMRHLMVYWSVRLDDDRFDPSQVLVVLSDVTDAVQRRMAAEQLLERQRTLHHFGVQLASTLELEPSLELIVTSCQQLVGADIVGLITLDHDQERIDATHVIGASPDVLASFDYRYLTDVLLPLILDAGGVIFESPRDDHLADATFGAALDTARARGLELASIGLVAVKGDHGVSGILAALNTSGSVRGLEERDLGDLALLAAQAAMALQRSRLHSQTVRALDELRATQESLLESRKMESLGVLAAGVAHEINTPVQFIGDNVTFLGEVFEQLLGLATTTLERLSGTDQQVAVHDVLAAIAAADLDYLNEDVPLALRQTADGINRVATIVRALKEFSHPGSSERGLVDLEQVLTTVTTISRNEWRNHATVEVDVDPSTPPIWAFAGELNQVILNLVVNAAHAIADRWTSDEHNGAGAVIQGRIGLSAGPWGDGAEIRVSDNGSGIRPEHRSMLFDQFFTTKEVGRGTGQGLTLAYREVVQHHGGELTFESEVGAGTTFIVRLPLGDNC